jgi:hypothetical protein
MRGIKRVFANGDSFIVIIFVAVSAFDLVLEKSKKVPIMDITEI